MTVWKDSDGRWFATDGKGTQHTLRAKERREAYTEAKALLAKGDRILEIDDEPETSPDSEPRSKSSDAPAAKSPPKPPQLESELPIHMSEETTVELPEPPTPS